MHGAIVLRWKTMTAMTRSIGHRMGPPVDRLGLTPKGLVYDGSTGDNGCPSGGGDLKDGDGPKIHQ